MSLTTITPAGVRRIRISYPDLQVFFTVSISKKINNFNNDEFEIKVKNFQEVLNTLDGLRCNYLEALQDLTVFLGPLFFFQLGSDLLRRVINAPHFIFLQRLCLKKLRIPCGSLVKALSSFRRLEHCSLDNIVLDESGLPFDVEPLANTLSSLSLTGHLQSHSFGDSALVNEFGNFLASQEPPLPLRHLELRSCDQSILPSLLVSHQDLTELTIDFNVQPSTEIANPPSLRGRDAGHALRLGPLKTIRILNLNVACFNEVINFFSAMHVVHDQGHMHTREIQVHVEPPMLQSAHKSLWLKLDGELNRFANASIEIVVEMGGTTASSPINATLVHDLRARLKNRFFLGDSTFKIRFASCLAHSLSPVICVDLGNEMFVLTSNACRFALSKRRLDATGSFRKSIYRLTVIPLLGMHSSSSGILIGTDSTSRSPWKKRIAWTTRDGTCTTLMFSARSHLQLQCSFLLID
ncbi:hypothetical protein HGRIS_000068 [Hohenbuehelia grisea]|uniref:Uncharacterized protein n=1 Tax=Hohenbuehelia grisea TaxID=104357 RepID=A0ABR3JR05_9AGAR